MFGDSCKMLFGYREMIFGMFMEVLAIARIHFTTFASSVVETPHSQAGGPHSAPISWSPLGSNSPAPPTQCNWLILSALSK